MSKVSYCPKCGETYFGNGVCSYCGEKYILTKYTDDEYYDDICRYEQKIFEEYINKSPEFDKELARKRKKENDTTTHGSMSYEEKTVLQNMGVIPKPDVNIPKCPTCGSTNVNKISTVKKAAGFLTVGVFSSNLGKTMECKNCGYKW